MNPGLLAQIAERLERDGLAAQAARLVLAGCHGPAALERCLASGEVEEGAQAAEEAGAPGVFLRSIQVSGFRGIGPSRTLELAPGPGLTLVVGRNGSGKSSFAEALEVLLTGDSYRWLDRPKVWREGWQNLHAVGPVEVSAELVVDGEPRGHTWTRRWPAGAPLEKGVLTPELRPGWEGALESYRPFLSYSELAKLVNEEPSKLHDGLSSILGLGDLVAAEKTLRERRLAGEKAAKQCAEEARVLASRLQLLDDPRAEACRSALIGKTWRLEVLAEHLGQDAQPEGLEPLKALASLAIPEVKPWLERCAELRLRREALHETQAERDLATASLLEQALVVAAGDDCPVCGGPLPGGWAERAASEAARLRRDATEAQQLRREEGVVLRQGQALCTGPPSVLRDRPTWAAWEAWSRPPDTLAELEAHLATRRDPLAEEVHALAEGARAELARLQSAWQPLALELGAWLLKARQVEAEREQVKSLVDGEKWLKGAAAALRNERMRPIAEAALQTYAQLRQDSNVQLKDVTLHGGSTGVRRVALDVQVDDVEGAALGVMSQGELNALALSLFLPRATLPESPFRFVVIDDPVQAMDPAKVDGLARVLERTARTHQVLVLTHDARLYESVRRLGIDATVLAVTRRERSVVELRLDMDPVSRSLADAEALARTDRIDARVAARVVPRFCRDAVEAALAEVARRRLFSEGRKHEQIEALLGESRTLNKLSALALCGNPGLVPEAKDRLARLGVLGTFQELNRGAHDAHLGNLTELIEGTRELVRRVRS